MTDSIQHNKWQLLGAGWALIAVYLLWGHVIPEFRHTMQIYASLQDRQEQIASARNWESRLERLNGQRESLEDYFSKIFVSLPDNDQMSAIIDQLSGEAEKAGVRLTQMRPAERTQHESYVEIPIFLQVRGDYHQIGRFVNGVEQSTYLMKTHEIHIRAEKEKKTDPALTAQIVVKVIILKRNRNGNSEQTPQTDA